MHRQERQRLDVVRTTSSHWRSWLKDSVDTFCDQPYARWLYITNSAGTANHLRCRVQFVIVMAEQLGQGIFVLDFIAHAYPQAQANAEVHCVFGFVAAGA